MHEGIPILNYLVPKAFTARRRQADRRAASRRSRREYDEKGRRQLVPTGEPDVHFECDDVLVAVGQENAFPWIERDIGIEFDEWGMPVVDPVDDAVDPARTCSSAATRRSGRRTSSGPSRTATRRRSRSTSFCHGEDVRERPPPRVHARQPEDGHPRVELRQRHLATTCATRCRCATQAVALQRHQGRGRARLRPRSSAYKEAQRCLNCDVQTVFADDAVHRVRRLRRHLPDGLHHLHRRTATRRTCARGCSAPALQPRRRTSMSPTR